METHYHVLVLVFGILGNIVGFIVYLAPMVTLHGIFPQQKTQNYNFIPYSLSLFLATLMLYYANLKGNEALLLITINSAGCTMEVAYLIIVYIHATSRARLVILRWVILFNGATYLLIVILLTFLVSPLNNKLKVVGWICATFSVGVYVASLISAMIKVMRTKSAKSISMPLSICLTLSSIIWFFYGLFSHDYFVAMPNVQGFLFGVAQIILYFIYRNGGADERERVPSETRENNENDEILEIIELQIAETMKNTNGTGVELEATEVVHLHDNVVTRNDSRVVHNEIHSVAEPEIVEIPG